MAQAVLIVSTITEISLGERMSKLPEDGLERHATSHLKRQLSRRGPQPCQSVVVIVVNVELRSLQCGRALVMLEN